MAELTEQEKETFKCSICGWQGTHYRSLSVHKGRSHKEVVAVLVPTPVPAQVPTPVQAQVPPPMQAPLPAPMQDSEAVIAQINDLACESSIVENVEISEEFVESQVESVPTLIDNSQVEETPVIEVPSATPPNPMPKALDPKLLGIKEILVGSVLKLQGPHYVFAETKISGPEIAEDIQAKVNFRWQDSDLKQFYLRARSEGGSQQWVVSEQDVLESNNVQLISLGERSTPKNYVSDVPTPPEDLPEDPGPTPEEKAKQEEFVKMLQRYVQFRDAKISAEKAFKAADQEARPVILDYVQKYGIESEEGKGDNVLLMEGYKTHWTFTPGESFIQRDESKILKYLHDNWLHRALDYKVNWSAWEKLKENGTIPASFIAEVERPAQKDDFRKLLIEPDNNFKS